MKYLYIITLVSAMLASRAQNNIIPNPDFEQCSATGCIPGTSFGSNLAHWRMYQPCSGLGCNFWEESHTQWILNADQTKPFHYTQHSRNCTSSGQDRFILLGTFIDKENSLFGDDYDCDRIGKDNVAVALTNNQFFNNSIRYKIRYKILPMPGTCTADHDFFTCEEEVSPSCRFRVNSANLRIFVADKGPNNWLDNNSNLEELISANFSGTNITLSGCNWRVIEREFTVNASNMTTLAFLTHSGSFLLDDVEVFPVCDNNYLIQNKVYNSNSSFLYRTNMIEGNSLVEFGGTNLTAGSNVGLNNGIGPVIVDNQSDVRYLASSSVKLKTRFVAQKGCHFNAAIATCPSGRQANTNVVGTVGEVFKDLKPVDRAATAIKTHDAMVSLKTFPNPVSNTVKIQSDLLAAGVKIIVYNSTNQQVAQYVSNAGSYSYEIDCHEFAEGVYFLNLYGKEGRVMGVSKIVKQ